MARHSIRCFVNLRKTYYLFVPALGNKDKISLVIFLIPTVHPNELRPTCLKAYSITSSLTVADISIACFSF